MGYHLKILREAGLARLSATRQVRGGTEQYFTLVSRAFRLHENAETGPEFLVQAALAEMTRDRAGHTALYHLWLTDEEAEALPGRLETFTEDRARRSDGCRPYGLLLSLYRADIPTLPEATEPG